jgi:RNA polymerase sigma-70 factor, ECF subfamily
MVQGQEPELIRRVLGGMDFAYADLVAPFLPEAARLAYGLLQDRCAAEDCVQEAALLAWQRLGNLQGGRPFRPWFLGIVVNRCREARRSRWWGVTWLFDSVPDSSNVNDWTDGADLRRAVGALPHRLRAAIVLHFYLDLPIEEAATVLGISVAGAKSRINRGLRGLRRTLEQR